MPYRLLKARINTNFNRAVKPFKTAAAFAAWTDQPAYQIAERSTFSDVNLESGAAQYDLRAASSELVVEIRIMQSAKLTTYCFDVFIVLHYTAPSKALDGVAQLYQTRLAALRQQYNGDWIIGDQDLTLSCLR